VKNDKLVKVNTEILERWVGLKKGGVGLFAFKEKKGRYTRGSMHAKGWKGKVEECRVKR